MTVTSHATDAPSTRKSLRERISLIRYLIGLRHQALLTVRDRQGVMRTSLIEVKGGEGVDSVTFSTDAETGEQIVEAPEVILTYVDWHSGSWLVLNGIASTRHSTVPAWCRETLNWLTQENPRSVTTFEVDVITADVWE